MTKHFSEQSESSVKYYFNWIFNLKCHGNNIFKPPWISCSRRTLRLNLENPSCDARTALIICIYTRYCVHTSQTISLGGNSHRHRTMPHVPMPHYTRILLKGNRLCKQIELFLEIPAPTSLKLECQSHSQGR